MIELRDQRTFLRVARTSVDDDPPRSGLDDKAVKAHQVPAVSIDEVRQDRSNVFRRGSSDAFRRGGADVVVADTAPLLTELLGMAPGLVMLVTSLTVLSMSEEHEFPPTGNRRRPATILAAGDHPRVGAGTEHDSSDSC
jgi:hypothetical protein